MGDLRLPFSVITTSHFLCKQCAGLIFFLIMSLTIVDSSSLTRIVQTRFGKIQGIIRTVGPTKYLKPVDMFLGVPYATPPVGSNRFSPTRTVAPWTGVRLANIVGPVCPQKLPDISNETSALGRMPRGRLQHLKRLLPFLTNQNEDCLYLNIYAPAQARSENNQYPVIIFIHGDDYTWGSGNPYDGSVLASYGDLVVVTINYRLGVLGFLNTNPSPHYKARVANYGLMDQIAALHWVQQNIAFFNGDPRNVTLVGHGTGAACIHFLAISPAVTTGLFHRAILLSGSAFSSWALVEDPLYFAENLARQLNCTVPEDIHRDHETIVDCLREVPLLDLMGADIAAPAFLSSFGPSVDGVVIKHDFHRDAMYHYLPQLQRAVEYNYRRSSEYSKNSKRYDLMFGVVTSESLWKFSAYDIRSGFDGERRDKILRTYVRNAYVYHLSEIFVTIVNEYTDWERTVVHPINTRDATIAALSDAQFVAPVVRTGDIFSSTVHSDGSRRRTYFYVFDYQTKEGDYTQKIGTVHGEELPYVFGAPLVQRLNHFSRNFSKPEVALSESLIIYLSNFARTGNPNAVRKQEPLLPLSKERNRYRSVVWEEYDPVHQKYLEIGIKPKTKNHFRSHQLSIWLRLIPELHRAGMEDVFGRHNLFRNHYNINLYDGVVRPEPHLRNKIARDHLTNGTASEVILPITTMETIVTTCVNLQIGSKSYVNQVSNISDAVSTLEAAAAYSTALSVTIGIGCSLLVLNILIFAVVYYQRDRTKLQLKNIQEQRNIRNYDSTKHFPTSASVVLDVERDTSKMVLTRSTSATGKPLATFMNHVVEPKSSIVTTGKNASCTKINKSVTIVKCTDQNCTVKTPNGSSTYHMSSLPRPPPPPKCKTPPESQHFNRIQCKMYSHTLPKRTLKVPSAAISEMRV